MRSTLHQAVRFGACSKGKRASTIGRSWPERSSGQISRSISHPQLALLCDVSATQCGSGHYKLFEHEQAQIETNLISLAERNMRKPAPWSPIACQYLCRG
jgi:hypothetical protein